MRIGKIIHRLIYLSILWKIIDRTSKSLLDIGCGKGSSIVRIIHDRIKGHYIIGCDIYPLYVRESKRSRLYDECIIADAHRLPFRPYSFDIVLCLEVIEHLGKSEGEALLPSLEELCSKEIVLSAPIGFMYQGLINGNPFLIHKSAWFPCEFMRRGYKVVGVAGPLFLRGQRKYTKIGKVVVSAAGIISLLLQPLYYYFPNIASEMIDVKNKRT